MKKIATVLCSISFAIFGICLATLNNSPLPMPGNIAVNAQPILTDVHISKDSPNSLEKQIARDTVVIHDTVPKYVRIRIKEKSESTYLPAFSIKIQTSKNHLDVEKHKTDSLSLSTAL